MMTDAYIKLNNLSARVYTGKGDQLLHERVALVLVCAYSEEDMIGRTPREEVIRWGFEMDDTEWSITKETMIEHVIDEHLKHPECGQWAVGCVAWIREYDNMRAFT
jgi:hypothetical protein